MSKEKWLTSEEVMKRWGIYYEERFFNDILKEKGFPAYSRQTHDLTNVMHRFDNLREMYDSSAVVAPKPYPDYLIIGQVLREIEFKESDIRKFKAKQVGIDQQGLERNTEREISLPHRAFVTVQEVMDFYGVKSKSTITSWIIKFNLKAEKRGCKLWISRDDVLKIPKDPFE